MFPTSFRIESLRDTLGHDIHLFIPELAVCIGIVALLLVRLIPVLDRVHLGGLAVVALGVALFTAGYQVATQEKGAVPYFGGMLVSDPFAGLARCLVLLAALLTAMLTQLTAIPDRNDSSDFHTLLLGGTLGMMLMVSANHLMMVFIAVEMASLPGYALAGFLKGQEDGQRSGAQVRRLRRRRQRRDALRYHAHRRHVRHRLSAGRGREHRIVAVSTCRCSPGSASCSSGWASSSRRCRSTSGARTCSRARRPKSRGSCRSRRRPRQSR